MNEFVKPTIEYAQLWPLLLVFGVACVGVLVEAFLPRRLRYGVQTLLTLAGLIAAVVGVGFVAADAKVLADGAARGQIAAEGTIAVDGPTLFLWGLILLFAIIARAPVRRAQPRGRGLGVRRTGRGAAGQRGRAHGVDVRARPHRGLPADDVRGRRDDAVPGRQRPAHPVRGARGVLAAAVPPLRSRPPAPAAQPGGGAQVLPARRLLLRLLPVRHRAHLRLRRLDGVRRDQRGGPQRRRQPLAAADRHGHARGRPVLQGRRRAVPGLDPRRLPGRPDRGHRVHGRRDQGRRVRRDAAALLRRLRHRPLDLAADDVDHRDPHHGRRVPRWRSSSPT